MDLHALFLFRIGHHRFAVPAASVVEIVPLLALSPLPQAPEYILGAAHLRGRMVPVLDLALRLEHSPGRYGPADALLVMAHQGQPLALPIHEMLGVMTPPANAWLPPPPFRGQLVDQLVAFEDDLVAHLNMAQLALFSEAVDTLAEPPEGDEPAARQVAVASFLEGFDPATQALLRRRAHALSQTLAQDQGVTRQFVLYHLAGETLATPLEGVHGFAPLRQLTPMPCCPGHILGSINYRGDSLTLVDVRPLLALPATGRLDKILVIDLRGALLGVAVEDILDVIATDPTAIGHLPSAIDTAQSGYFRGTLRVQEAVMMVLDLIELLGNPALEVREEV
ncbi:purine-binding chemotaxis protein CheW [Gammaproteobacteria bacterium]